MRKIMLLVCACLLMAWCAGCEKVAIGDGVADVDDVETPVDVPSGGVDTLVSDLAPSAGNKVTVAQFLNYEIQGEVYLEGYIVGSCQQAIKYADYEAPFEGHTALLLADKMTERDAVVAIHLKTGKMRELLNLEDHPENWGKRLRVKGAQGTYLGIAGMPSSCVTLDYTLLEE